MTEPSPMEAIFTAALERATAAERAAFLEEACAGDEDLRRRVDRLLAAYAQVGDFLDRPIAEAANLAAFTPPDAPERGAASLSGRAVTERPEAAEALAFLAPSQKSDSLGRLGHYEVLEVVGKGGMGVVLRAFDEKLHRVVAIKVLAPALATSGSARQRFVREARAAAAVTHDNVIAIHAVEDDGPVPYLVMQFIHGSTLQEKVDRSGPLPVKEILRIGLQTAAGLAAAHAQGLVHRDVKPANILLENSVERVKITDFGLARAVDDAGLSQSGLIAGTPTYMSPEQANGAKVDPRSDLFSLGSVLYTLCAGHAPFRAEMAMAILKRICSDTPRPVREVNADIPDWLEAILARLHAKDPADRFQTAAEVADLLGRHLAHLQQANGPPLADASRRPTPAPAKRLASSGQPGTLAPTVWRAAGVTLVLALLAVAAGVLGTRPWNSPPPQADSAPSGASSPTPAVAPGAARLTAAELARLPSPLDTVNREIAGWRTDAPPDVLAVLDRTHFAVPRRDSTHWMTLSPDGQLLAVPNGNDVILFDARTGLPRRTLTGHTSNAYRPAFSPDGRRLVSGSEEILRGWDVASGRELFHRQMHTGAVWTVVYDPAGKRLASADSFGKVLVWDADGTPVASLGGHTSGVNQVAFSPDGRRLASASLDGTCRVWDVAGQKEICALRANGRTFEAVAWSADGKRLAAGDDIKVLVWDIDTDADLYRLRYALNTPGKGLVAFTPDGQTLITARHECEDGKPHAFSRWDAASGTLRATLELPTRGGSALLHLSPDGNTVFGFQSYPSAGRVRAYDAVTGKERFPDEGHEGAVSAVAFSPDGCTLATGGDDRVVRLWDLAGWTSGARQPPSRILSGHGDAIGSVAFSPDGRLLASGSTNGLLFVWEVATGRKVYDLVGHSRKPSRLAFSPDGTTLAAGGEDGTVNRWDVRTGKRLEALRWNAGPVGSVVFSPDGRRLACGDARVVQLIDLEAGRLLHTFRAEAPLTNLAFSPDGVTLAAACQARPAPLRLWNVATGAERTLTRHTEAIVDLVFHPAGRLAATASADASVRLWDLTPEGLKVKTIDFSAWGQPRCVAFTPQGRHLAVGLDDGTTAILRVPSPPDYTPSPAAALPDPTELAKRPGPADALRREDIPSELILKAGGDSGNAPPELVAVFGADRHTGPLFTVAISPDGKTLAYAGADDKVVRVRDLATGKPRRTLTWDQRFPDDHVYSLAFSPDGKLLAGAGNRKTIFLWEADTGKERGTLGGSSTRLTQIAFSPDGTLLASAGVFGGDSGLVRVWNVASGRLVFTAATPDAWPAWCVTFSPDGKALAAGLESGDVRLWDLASGWEVANLTGHGGRVRWVGFHPDGRSLVAAGSWTDHTVCLWDLATRQLRRRLPGHLSEVLSGAWRKDGRLLVTAGATDGTVRLWDVSGGPPRWRVIPVIPPNRPWLHGIALSPEGRYLAVCNPDGTVYVLRLAKPGEVCNVPADGKN